MRKLLISAISSRVYVCAYDGVDPVLMTVETAARTTSSIIGREADRAVRQMGGLDAIGVVVGPGSWAGARITIATAKGMALATGCQSTMIPTHDLVWASRPQPQSGSLVIWAAEREPWIAHYEEGRRIAAVAPIPPGDWNPETTLEGRFDRKTHILLSPSDGEVLLPEPFDDVVLMRAMAIAQAQDGACDAHGLKTPFMPSYPPKQ